MTSELDYPEPSQFIGGEWCDGSAGTVEHVLSPATEETIATFGHVGGDQLDAALGAMSRVAGSWRDRPPLERSAVLRGAAQLLRDRSDALAHAVSLEQGKPLAEARAEIAVSADVIDWCAEEGRRTYGRIVPSDADGRLMVTTEPIGPVAAFTPWNFPVLTVSRKLGAALAAGCTVVVKASEETPAGAMGVLRALQDAGLPDGVANLVLGVPADVSRHLLARGVIRKVSLTGSIAVGRVLSHLAADHSVVTTMELGGNAPVVVEHDVDVAEVASRLAKSKFRNAGQVCNSPSRFFVHDDVHDAFVEAVAGYAEAIVVGPGTDPATTMGALANRRRVEYVAEVVDQAVNGGATLVRGGGELKGPGFYFEPTVLTDVADNARVFAEEVFGPVVPVARYSDLCEVLTRANATTYGLGAFVFTASLEKAHHMARSLDVGMVGINTTVISRAETPFGGINASGHGWESGVEGVDVYLRRKAVLEHGPVRPGSGVSH